MNLRRRNPPIVALVKADRELQLTQIGFHRGGHVGVLQLAGERGAIERGRPVYLPQRSGARRCSVEIAKPAPPIRPELAGHPPANKRPTHRRRVRLQLNELLHILFGQSIRDRGEQLRHFHQRPFDAAEHRLELGGVTAAIEVEAEIARAREPGREPTHCARNLGVAPHPSGQRIVVGHDYPTIRVIPGWSEGPGLESLNTRLPLGTPGRCSWFPGSWAPPTPRNDGTRRKLSYL